MEQIIMRILCEVTEINLEEQENSNLIDTGILDSLTMVDLIEKLERELLIDIKGEDIVPDNFQNIDTIINLINKSRK